MIFRICPIYQRASFLSSCNTHSTRNLHSLIQFHTYCQPAKIASVLANSHSPRPTPCAVSPPSSLLSHLNLKLNRSLHNYSKISQQHRSYSAGMSANGEARPKRRSSPISALERPKKQLKQENGVPTPGDATPQNGSVYDVEAKSTSVPIINTVSAAGDSPEWQATIEKVIKSVVSIHFCQTCSFDTDLSTSSQATGFVVDAENGYILTNRHVVCSGPFWGYCVFDNHEEVGVLSCDLIPTC
jgi:hypothetical protein